MKALIFSLLIFPMVLSAAENITCVENNIQLDISVNDSVAPMTVSWKIQVIDNEAVTISGEGLFQKEVDSADAFSSYDDNTAISYKEQRAVFVMEGAGSVYFPSCTYQAVLSKGLDSNIPL